MAFGANYYGFMYDASQCNDRTPPVIFTNNLAHSIAGFGFISGPSNREGTTDCTDVSNLKGYKNWKATVQHA